MNKKSDRVRAVYPEKLRKPQDEYRNPADLNVSDPSCADLGDGSMNDYLKGYNQSPYEFKQWAKKKNIFLTKTADIETVVMQFTPEFLADRILTLWNGADGPLQNFFDLFTLNYDNKMKLDITALLKSKGYNVYPTLVDDKPRYATRKKIKSIIASNNMCDALNKSASIFGDSDGLKLLAGEVSDLIESNYSVSNDELLGIFKYYIEAYKDDKILKAIYAELSNSEIDSEEDASDIDKKKQ